MKRGAAAVLGCALAAASIAWASVALAGDEVEGDLHDYYGGEMASAAVIGGLGAAAAGTGAYLATRSSDFARGLGWSWIGMGAVEAVGAVGYAIQVHRETGHYEALLARDPVRYRSEETVHMRGTKSRFVAYRIIELGLTVAGGAMAAYGLAADKDVWKGAGLGIGSLSLPFLVIDTVNDARASRHLRQVETYQPSLGVGPVGNRGLALSLSGRF